MQLQQQKLILEKQKYNDSKIAQQTEEKIRQLEEQLQKEKTPTKTEVEKIVKTEVNKVNDKQVTQINSKLDKIDKKLPKIITPVNVAVAVEGLEILRQTKNRPIPISPCLAPVFVPPVATQARINGGLTTTLQGVTVAQGARLQSLATRSFNLLNDGTFGLQRIQNFASTAWEATHADKILSAATTAVVIHNGFMLSKGLGYTIGEAASQVLQAMNIKDSSGEFFDVNQVVGGKIGNALRDAGAVYEDAYSEMLENVNPQNAAMRKLEGLTTGISKLTDAVDSIESVSSNVIEIQETYTELQAQKQVLKDEADEAIRLTKEGKDEAKEEVQAKTDVESLDFEPAPPEDTGSN